MFRTMLRHFASALSSVVVLGVLIALGMWGHHSHWTIPKFQELTAHAAAATTKDQNDTQLTPSASSPFPTIVFEHQEEVGQNGLQTSITALQPLDEYVQTNAVVGYNERQVAQLSARVSGHVWAVRTRLGQKVKKGDVLALIDSKEVGQAKADYLHESVMACYRTKRLKQLRFMGTDIVARNDILKAEFALKETQLKRFNARQRLINLGFPPQDLHEVADLPIKELSQRIQFLGLPPDVRKELDPLPDTANLIPLIAPFDGVVTELNVVAGEMVYPDRPQMVIADVRTMWINLSVRQEDAVRLELGQPVEFYTEGVPGRIHGKLSWISTGVNKKTRTVQARCEVVNPLRHQLKPDVAKESRLLRANLFGTARVRVAHYPSALVVPVTAVQWMPDLTPLVFISQSDGRRFEPRRVHVGLNGNGVIQVLEGLRPGEQIVTQGSFVLKAELMRAARESS